MKLQMFGERKIPKEMISQRLVSQLSTSANSAPMQLAPDPRLVPRRTSHSRAALECFVLSTANLKHLHALGHRHPDALSLKCPSVLVVSIVAND